MNEWMRTHKALVFTFALLGMLGLTFYGVSYLVKGASGAGRGPSGGYVSLNGSRINVEPEELFQERLMRWHYGGGSELKYPSEETLKFMARVRIASDMGFAVGDEELMHYVRNDIKRRTGKDRVTPDLVGRLLDELQLTQSQFERLTREMGLLAKVLGLYTNHLRMTDGEEYLDYVQRKQSVRIFYKEFKTKDYEEVAGDPSPDEIEKYYKTYSVPPKDGGTHPAIDSLDTDPELSVDVLYYSKEYIEKDWNPTEKQLKDYYKQYRNFFRVKTEPGKPMPEGDAAYEPYDKVKDKVLKDYMRQEMQTRANEMKKEFEKEIAEEEKKAKEAGKKFDIAAFAEKKKLTYWRTAKLPQRGFSKGSQKIKAEDFSLAGDMTLFRLTSEGKTDEEKEMLAKARAKFTGARRILYNTKEEGFVMFRIAEYTDKALMTLEQATPVIKRRLREDRAKKKAAEAADEFLQKWESGEQAPGPKDLQDETCRTGNTNPLYMELSSNPVPVGEIMGPAFDPDKEARKDRPDTRHGRYLVGFIAERDCPSLASFESDAPGRQGVRRSPYEDYYRGERRKLETLQFLSKAAAVEMEAKEDLPLSARREQLPPPPM